MTTRTERKKIRFRFVLLYSLSLVLLFVLVSAFWKRLAPKNQPEVVTSSENETWFLQTDTALHARMEAMDKLAEANGKARAAGAQPDTLGWMQMRLSLSKALDSVDQQASYLGEGPKKATMTLLTANFRKALARRQAATPGTVLQGAAGGATAEEVAVLKQLLNERDQTIAGLQKQAQTTAANGGSVATNLQNMIVEKDRSITSLQNQINSLQNQLRQNETAASAKPADNSQKNKTIQALQNQLQQKEAELRTALAARPVAGGGEWKQKYQSLKSSFDKVSESEKALKGANQSLADDNRRLLNQLQAARGSRQ